MWSVADIWGEAFWSGNTLTTCTGSYEVTRRGVLVQQRDRQHAGRCGDGDIQSVEPSSTEYSHIYIEATKVNTDLMIFADKDTVYI